SEPFVNRGRDGARPSRSTNPASPSRSCQGNRCEGAQPADHPRRGVRTMKAIDLVSRRPTLDALLRMARKENLVLRTGQGREFVLAELDESDRELALMRQNKQLMRLLASRSKEKGRHTLEQVRRRLG